ncbi:MAG TPA: L,D-transpeptidase [Candidatus Paceibacterota bacterium]
MTEKQKTILIVAGALIAVGIVAFSVFGMKTKETEVGIIPPSAEETPTVPEPATPPSAPLVVPEKAPEGPTEGQEYYFHTMKSANAQTELEKLVGAENVTAVLQTNRIDAAHIKAGAKIVIPVSFDSATRSPFPLEVPELSEVKKLLLISQRVQAFGVYESGKLVRWGPVSTGKQSTQTPSKLFSTNWKGKEVKSSFDDEWILKFNFNLDNTEGVGFHQYEMPGYPASHSCVRMLMDDAMWLYDWADQWILTENEQSRYAHGTPVVIFGQYGFGKTAPWKLLPEDADATDITKSEMDGIVDSYLDTIMERQEEREAYIEGLTAAQ